MNKSMLVFVAYFLEYVLLFQVDNMIEKYKNFQIAKDQLQGFAQVLFFGGFFVANFSLALFIKVLVIKERVTYLFLIFVNEESFFQEYIEMELNVHSEVWDNFWQLKAL